MRVLITGGAGFIGRAVVGILQARGDTVVALVRDPARAAFLEHPGTTLVRDDLSDSARIASLARDVDVVVHGAGSYRVGINRADRPAMLDANLGTTERVLDAAADAGVSRTLYVSTANVYGNTRGALVDEAYRRDPGAGFLSWYDETKYRAHVAAEERMAAGLPLVIVQPTQVYGPHDHSLASVQLARAHAGRLQYVAFAGTKLGWVHVEDLATGIVAALDRGRTGEAYNLAGPAHAMGEAVSIAARVGGRRPPALTMPDGLVRLLAPLNDALGGLPGMPPNLAEVVRASVGTSYTASAAKAAHELRFAARPLAQGIADTWGTARRPAGV